MTANNTEQTPLCMAVADADDRSLLSAVLFEEVNIVRARLSAGANVNIQHNDGTSPLMIASHNGHIDLVKLLIESGAETEICTNQGTTALYIAAKNDHAAVVQFLIEHHADVNACDSDGQSCLLSAVFGGHIEVVCALVSAGADINLQRNDGVSPLMLASVEGHTDIVKLLVDNGAEIETRDKQGRTSLYLAAMNGYVEVVQFLIERNADVNACDSDGQSCLLSAVWDGHVEVVRTLVSAGADVNLQRTDGVSPLMVASEKGRINVVQFLTEHHADVNACDSDGQSCLLAAVCGEHTEVVRALVSAGADVNLQCNDGAFPLMLACQESHTDIVKLLVDNGANIETRDKDGDTSLCFAAVNGHVEVVQFLIENHADVNACDSDGQSCLLSAVCGEHTEVVRALVSAGADVNLQRNDGDSPLMLACQEGHTDIVKLLVRNGADTEPRNKDGDTSLHFAARKCNAEVVQFLIEHHADVNACDSDGQSCLHSAVFDGHTEVVRALVSVGANVNLQRNDGVSPLMLASQESHTDIVKLLVDNGAEIATRDKDGDTSLCLAAYNGHASVVQFLVQHHADVNACDSDGQSCLLSAVFGGHAEVVCALVSAGAQVNSRRNDGNSPLIVASEKGHTDIVKLLVDSGAEIETHNNISDTSLIVAARSGHAEVVQFLIEHHADVSACNNDGQSCLLLAVFGGHTEVVHTLVSAGADVNLQSNDGDSPLMVASDKGYFDFVMILLDNNAYTESRDHSGHTALWSAAQNGHTAVVKALIDHGADVDAIDYKRRSPVCAAAVVGHIKTVETLIQHHAIIRHENGSCQDPLAVVAAQGKGEVEPVLRLLMNDGTCVVHTHNYYNMEALISAVSFGRLNVVKVLVESGADIHARYKDNLQAVDIASYCGHVDIVRYLLDCFHTHVASSVQHNSSTAACQSPCTHSYCNTALHLTIDTQHMKSLLEITAGVEAENIYGERSIHCAVRTGNVKLVELLIQYGADVNADDVFGNRPLHEAVCHGLDVVQLLVQRGAKLNVQNIDGKTPLHIAVEREQTDVIMFFMKSDADIAVTDVWRNTPLHYLTTGQLVSDELKEYIRIQTEKYQHLLVCNALAVTAPLQMTRENTLLEPTYTDCYGNTPLHRAVGVYGHVKIYRVSINVAKTVEFLVEAGADINAQNNNGLTPLHVARGEQAMKACLQHTDDKSFTTVDKRGRTFWHLVFILRSQDEVELAAIKPLIKSTSDASVDDLKRTSLHYACMGRNGWIALRSWLAEKFINQFSDEHIDKQDIFGRTALHYAAMADNSKLTELLKTKTADDTIRDKFEKTASQYKDICTRYNVNVSQLRLQHTSSFVTKNFRKISVCIQRCCSDGAHISDSCKTELLNIIYDLRNCGVKSDILNVSCGCRFDYSDVVCDKSVSFKHQAGEQVDIVTNDSVSGMSNSKMFEAIHSKVEKAMKYLAAQISDKEPQFACENVIQVGSSFERTKIGCCDEFDYNFVLGNLSKKCNVCYSPESPPGFVLLKASTPTYDKELFNNNGILNTRIVKFKFEMLVKEILSSFSFCDETGFEFIDPVQESIVPSGTTSTKLHTHVKLAFTKPVSGYYVPHNVSIDVVPALHIDGWWPDDMREEELRQPYDCLIVFTQPQIKYPWIGWTEPHGFVSFAHAESRLLRKQREVIRDAYKVVKRMSKYFCQYEFFTSYVIKTALLWCLDEDRHRHDRTSSDDSDEVSEAELLRWVQNILQRLLRFAAQDYVPTYFLPKCHQPVWLNEKYLKQFHMYLYLYGLMKYEDLFSFSEQQSQDEGLQYIKALFIFSHVMYWTMMSDADEVKLFVPSTINPLTEDDVCTTLIL